MKTLGRVLGASLVVLGTAAVASAAVLWAPPLNVPSDSGHLLACRVVNASSVPRTMNVQLLDESGAPIIGVAGEVPPGGIAETKSPTASPASCRAIVQGGKTLVRGTLSIDKDVGGGKFVPILTVPLQ